MKEDKGEGKGGSGENEASPKSSQLFESFTKVTKTFTKQMSIKSID